MLGRTLAQRLLPDFLYVVVNGSFPLSRDRHVRNTGEQRKFVLFQIALKSADCNRSAGSVKVLRMRKQFTQDRGGKILRRYFVREIGK